MAILHRADAGPVSPGCYLMIDRTKPGVAFWASVVVVCLALLAGYGGAYWALLDPDPHWDRTVTEFLPGPGGEGRYILVPAEGARLVPQYRFVGRVGEVIFAPARWVDTKLRR